MSAKENANVRSTQQTASPYIPLPLLPYFAIPYFLLKHCKLQFSLRLPKPRIRECKRCPFARVVIAMACVPVDEFRAGGDDAHEDGSAVSPGGFGFGGVHEGFANAAALDVRTDGEHAEVKLIAILPEFYAADDAFFACRFQ